MFRLLRNHLILGSIKHSFSRNWSAYTYMKNYDSLYPFGVNGQVFYSIDTINPTTLHLSSGLYAKGEPLQNIELYYGKSNNQHAKIRVVTPKDTVELKLNPEKKLNRLELTKNSVMSLDLDFIDSDSIPFYGVDLKYPYGIQVDNYSNRGNSGLPITQLNTQLMHDFQEALNYDLIILHYGTNVLSSTTRNYSWYQSRMERVVDHLRNIFPKASIMVVSIADKSTKYETEMQTDSSVVRLLNLQRKYAENKQTGFVNLFQLMGGENSMIKWVEEEPERANKDYTHFNHRGAKEIAQMIYKEIIQGFQDYIRKQKLLEEEKEYLRVQDSIQKVEEKRRLEQKMEEEFELKKDSVHVSEN